MFCFQCEQTSKGEGCTKIGVCGKKEEVASLQDLLIYALKGLSRVAVAARGAGISERETNVFTVKAAFSTLTNVCFDPERFPALIEKACELRERLKEKLKAASGKADFPEGAANFKPADSLEGLIKQGEGVGIKSDPDPNPDIHSLKWALVFGIKGISAYADHAQLLGKEDESVYGFVHEGLASTLRRDLSLDDWLKLVLKCGEANLKAMELLDDANTSVYGHPVPTKVPLGAKKGKAILVSGHDLKDLEEVLKLSEGKGIYVYTHGEMLPTHGYPRLKKYPHFYGHFGTAWQNQRSEFPRFPGPILMTTNCIQNPKDEYKENIFTTGLVGWPGVKHLRYGDFKILIDKALAMPGFAEDTNGKSVMCGFGRNAVLSVAGKVIELVKAKKIRHFFLVGGCDGAKPARGYYAEFVEKLPKDTVVLTLACGKFKFFDKDLGAIDGIPRLLDIGQCNDAYSAIQIAVALAKAFNVGVNELPLSIICSWYEQKAVAILLTLLYLGIKDIRLGPSFPAFLSPNVLGVLAKTFNIMPIGKPEDDIKAILG